MSDITEFSTQEASTGTILTKFVDPLRIPPLLRPRRRMNVSRLDIKMQEASLRLHSELPPSPLWTYAGHFPGPTIEVRRGQRLLVNWTNRIDGTMPVVAVEVEFPLPGPNDPIPQPGNNPGRDSVKPRQVVADLPPWTVVHLHGAVVNGADDGLPENASLPGSSQRAEYPNDHRATALWYHDHAMDVTRFNVMSGLAGMYLIRDEEEDKLKLPRGKREVPLIICDRNLDADSQGQLTGKLLHKIAVLTVPDAPDFRPMIQFFGPYTLVNGVIWPYLEVEACWYRFRMLNASNARIYRLFLLDEDNNVVHNAIKQIGTDSGLLPKPVPIDGELTLAPAERADILIDFRAFRGRNLRLVSTGGGAVLGNPPVTPGQAVPEIGLPEPDVMQFRVHSKQVRDTFTLPAQLSPSFQRITHDSLPPNHGHRWIIVSLPAGPRPEAGMWEMAEVDPSTVSIPGHGIVQVQRPGGRVITLKKVAEKYHDAPSFFVPHNSWEQWKFLNIGNTTHPMHIHLVGFQALSRDLYNTTTFDPAVEGTTTPITFTGPGIVDPNEQGWKDTIRVGPGEMVSVAGQFHGGTGRYVYHCHILEHEDDGMMRPFFVIPDQVMAVMPNMYGGPHSH